MLTLCLLPSRCSQAFQVGELFLQLRKLDARRTIEWRKGPQRFCGMGRVMWQVRMLSAFLSRCFFFGKPCSCLSLKMGGFCRSDKARLFVKWKRVEVEKLSVL